MIYAVLPHTVVHCRETSGRGGIYTITTVFDLSMKRYWYLIHAAWIPTRINSASSGTLSLMICPIR